MNRLMVNVKASPEIMALYDHKFLVPATRNSAGYDLRAASDGACRPGENTIVPTGLYIEILDGRYFADIRPRSGLGAKRITIGNSPGTIDADYRGEIGIILRNESEDVFRWKAGDRLAQMVFIQFAQPVFQIVSELGETERGEGGFGSTG